MATHTPSIIAAGVTIKGDMVTDGEVQLDGCIEGNLACNALVMGETGSITGNIIAQDVVIRGTINGEIHARTVRLEKSAVLEGNVSHFSLSVEAGARITGQMIHSDADPQAIAAQKMGAETKAENEIPDFLNNMPSAAE